MTVKAIYENGVFRPTQPVDLPDKAEVEVVLPETRANGEDRGRGIDGMAEEIFRLLRRSYATGQTDTAARHNEHQP